ncbi:MAG: hypothetical protein GEU82_06665 [Luteitalea sp.]|nr:hypothetical protein [Luteitalea sp.]
MTTIPAESSFQCAKRHLQFGWWSFFVFSTLGLVLEMLHGFKAGLYLDVSQETRRLMWTLAHAHGTLLALVHLVFALALRGIPALGRVHQRLISRCLMGASALLPGGFFLAGIHFYAGDPGFGILLVPPGAVLLLIAIALVARNSAHDAPPEEPARGRRS